MKRFINGEEVELGESPCVHVTRIQDRLLVKTPDGTFSAVAVRSGDTVQISYKGRVYTVEKSQRARASRAQSSGEMHAPMPGLIVDVLVEQGATVTKGQKILVLEAMKTQQPFVAPFDGTVFQLPVAKGQQVSEGALLALVEAAS
jgi:acetyl/propionyl-CoA carboxylase alpha subunit